MNNNIKLWIDALRSGEYKQGRRKLKNGDTYCCLGVLCDLYAKETGKGKWREDDQFLTDGRTSAFNLPLDVMKWAGVCLSEGRFAYGGKSLVALNDEGKSFSDIAEIIESEPEGLLK